DLTRAPEKITPEAINFMAKHGRGLICLTLTEQRCDELHLPLMSPINTSVHGTAFCEAIDARVGVTTVIERSSRANNFSSSHRPKTKATGPRPPWSLISITRAQRRGSRARGTDRSERGCLAPRWAPTLARH